MRRILSWLLSIGGLALIAVAVWNRPLSDAALMARFAQQQAMLEQIVSETQRDEASMYIDTWGTVWVDTLAEQRVDGNRIAEYRALLRQADVTSVSSSKDSPVVSFNTHQAGPVGPVKSFRYGPTPPRTLTNGNTDAYQFQDGQFQAVCRPLAPDWYLCLDRED